MHVTELRSARCREISERYADMAELALTPQDAALFRKRAEEYAKEAVDLVTGKANRTSLRDC